MNARLLQRLSACCVLVVLALPVAARPLQCSVHPKEGASKEELKAAATITEDEARKSALGSLGKSAKAAVKESELEVEQGCLVYSFDIEIAGESRLQEVLVDAGNGRVLSNAQESPEAEAAEKSKEKARP